MSDESLTKNQVTNLLKAMNQGSDTDHSQTSLADNSPSEQETAEDAKENANEKIADYDFRHANQVCRDQLQSVHLLHESVAADFAAVMSDMLRTPVDCVLEGVDQTSLGEFVQSMSDPGCVLDIVTDQTQIQPRETQLGDLQPGDLQRQSNAASRRWSGNVQPSDRWFAELEPTLVFALVDRMLGGEPNPGETIRREMTDIELRLIRRVANEFASRLQTAWARVKPGPVAVDGISSHPHRASVSSIKEPVVRVNFAVSFCGVRGMLKLGLPWASIEPIQARLAKCAWEASQATATDETREQIADQLATAPIDVVVNVAHSSIRTEDLLALAVGDVIATEKGVSDPLELSIQDVPKFHARAGAFKGKKAVQIESIVDKPTTQHHDSKLDPGEEQ